MPARSLLMKLIPDTIAGRTIAVLLISLIALHLASIWAYQIAIRSEIDITNEVRLAERLATIKRAIEQLPQSDRENAAHSLSGGPLEVHWSTVQLTAESAAADQDQASLRRRLLALAPELSPSDIIIGTESGSRGQSDPHLLLLSLKLMDGSWVNYTITKIAGPHTSFTGIILSTSLMALGVIIMSIWLLRTVTRPLRHCAEAAESLYRSTEPRPIGVSGPREVRRLATAFNQMQERVKRLVDDRTLTLAAISHDLKSPLSRLRLRTEALPEAEIREQMEADLAEMQAMIDASLTFLKGDFSNSEMRTLDLTAILESICGELSDAGKTVSLVSRGNTVLKGRHLALKRAFSNLIGNAVKYGRSAQVVAEGPRPEGGEAVGRTQEIRVTITDDGPGIPAAYKESVFAPFYRIDDSRNRETGGTGLGLTIARTVLRAHGGDVTLADAPGGGLKVEAVLPQCL